MANPIKGEVSFEAGDTRYKFVFGTYAQAALQRRTGKTAAKFFKREKDEDWGPDDILAVFHAGLLRHQEISEKEAADLMDEISMARVGEIITEAVALSAPEAAKDGSGRPQKATKSRTG